MLHSLQPQHFVIPRYLRTRSECPECKDRFIYGEGVMSLAHFRVTDTGEAGPGVLLLHHCFVRSTRRYWGSCIERERGSHWSGVRWACRLRGRRAPRCDLRFSMLKRPGIDQPPADRRAGILHNQDPAAGSRCGTRPRNGGRMVEHYVRPERKSRLRPKSIADWRRRRPSQCRTHVLDREWRTAINVRMTL
jgi:hypothetical protein